MLKSYLTSFPSTKIVIIEDSIQERGKPLFDFMLKFHINKSQNNIHYFIFQENYKRVLSNIYSSKLKFHNCSETVQGWDAEVQAEAFDSAINKLTSCDIVFIDSLAHVIYQFGLAETYRYFNFLKNKACVPQIITLLHTDLLENSLQIEKLFEHLCTLSISLQPKFTTNNRRVHYTYKKLGGKIIRQIEEYFFQNGDFITKKVEKIDAKKLLEGSTRIINPETLTTFKIGLTEKEKEARSQLILPYLPKQKDTLEGGQIFYDMDEFDDWDEEDPDDDLDI